MDKKVKTLYIRMLGNTKNPSPMLKLSIDEMEERCLQSMLAYKSFEHSVVLDGYSMGFSTNFHKSNDTLYQNEKDILRFLVRYRTDGPEN